MKNKKNRLRWKKWMISGQFIAPSFFGVMFFYIVPLFIVFFYSIVNNPIQKEFVGAENYIHLLQNGAFLTAAKNTAIFALISVPLAVAVSMGLAVILEQNVPAKSLFRTIFLSPMMIPVASIILVWQIMFQNNGAINSFLRQLSITAPDWFHNTWASMTVLTLLFLWKNLGYNMVLFMSALGVIPKELVESARVDGAGGFVIFWKIKIRFLAPTIVFVTVLSLIGSFKIFREVYLLTGNYPYDTMYLLQHFMNNMFRTLDYQKLSAAAIVMAVVIILILWILYILEDRFGKDLEG